MKSESSQYSRPPWRNRSRSHSSKLRNDPGHASRGRIARGEHRVAAAGPPIGKVDAYGLDVGVSQLEPALRLHQQIVDSREDDHGTDGRDRVDDWPPKIQPVGEHQPGSQSRRQAVAVAMLPGGDLPGIDARPQRLGCRAEADIQRSRVGARASSIPPQAIQHCTSSWNWLGISSRFTSHRRLDPIGG